MNCEEVRNLIDAYVDGELDLVTSLAIERHLQGCADCTRLVQSRQALHQAVANSSLYYRAPAGLRREVRASLRAAARPGATPRPAWWRALGLAGSLAVVALVLWVVVRGGLAAPANNDALAQQVLASHVRSLMPGHLEDVVSTDRHTVKPWFDGRLDFSPPVVDLASQGFPLVGGRLDYLDNRPVAALVYQRQQHVINLYVWPAANTPDQPATTETRQGYHLIHWTKAGMTYWAVSDVEQSQLEEFVRLVQSAAGP